MPVPVIAQSGIDDGERISCIEGRVSGDSGGDESGEDARVGESSPHVTGILVRLWSTHSHTWAWLELYGAWLDVPLVGTSSPSPANSMVMNASMITTDVVCDTT